jgi:putative transposase
MADEARFHNRRSIRLRGYDYTAPGAYFVTMVTHRRTQLFGEIAGGEMRVNEWGEIAADCWLAIPDHYDHVGLDEFMVMPNHFHGIIVISENETKMAYPVGAGSPRPYATDIPRVEPTRPLPTLGQIVAWCKYQCAKYINAARGTPAAPVWQRNYWEHIIRNDAELARIRMYIRNNPIRWGMDLETR